MPDKHDRQEEWAVFWCNLLSPLLYGEIPPEEARDFLRQLDDTEQLFPDGERKKPSSATLWRKWKQYRDGGFKALFRKSRNDRGKPRKASPAMVAKAIELKKDQPRRSDETINKFLENEFKRTIPPSTLYRHLREAGATRLKLGVSKKRSVVVGPATIRVPFGLAILKMARMSCKMASRYRPTYRHSSIATVVLSSRRVTTSAKT
jgi:hypothetical protein